MHTNHLCTNVLDMYRPVTSDKVDENMPLIGIPSFIKPAAPGSPPCTHYFVSIRRCSAAESEASPEGQAEAEAAERAAVTKLHTTMTRSQPSVNHALDAFVVHFQLNQLCSTAITRAQPSVCSLCVPVQ